MRVAFFGIAGPVTKAASGNVAFVVQARCDERLVSVLVDCSGTPAADLDAVEVDIRELDAVILTHTHTDHLYALPSLVHNALMQQRSRPLCIAGNSATIARAVELLGVFNLLDRRGMFAIEWRQIDAAGLRLPDGEAGLAITGVPVQHSVPTIGLRFEHSSGCLFYSCDTRPFAELSTYAQGASMLIHEASGLLADEARLNDAGHASARQAGTLAQTVGAGQLFLVHLPPGAVEGKHGELLREAAAIFCGGLQVPELRRWYHVREV